MLKEKMRSAADQKFSEICDRVGKGKITKEDLDFFMSRIQPTETENDNENFKKGLIYIIVTTNRYREEINLQKLNELLPFEKTYICLSDDKIFSQSDARTVTSDIPQSTTGNLPTQFHVKNGAPIVITTNHPKKAYKEDGLCNGSKGYVVHIQESEENEEIVEIIWIILNNKEFGKRYRFEHMKYRKNLNLPEEAIPIFPIKKRFTIKLGNIEYQRTQFSLNLAYALVVHKTQGHTFEGEAIVDYRDGFILPGSLYVAITRVKEGKKLFFRDFKETYVAASNDVEETIKEMQENKPYTFSKIYLDEQIFKMDKHDLKIGYLNVNSLFDGLHAECVNTDHHLQNLDLLVLSDTRLQESTSSEEVEQRMNNWKIMYRSDCDDSKRHMGMIFLTPKEKYSRTLKLSIGFEPQLCFQPKGRKDTKIQVVNIWHIDRKFTFLYCNSTPNKPEIDWLKNVTDSSDFVTGDMNLNPRNDSDKSKLNELCGKKKIIHLNRITTIQGNQLDHILINKDYKHHVVTDAFMTFASDHRTIVMRISKYSNDEIKEEIEEKSIQPKNYVKKEKKETTGEIKEVKKEKVIEVVDNEETETIDISRNDSEYIARLNTLDGSTWLNDYVVNYYGELLMKENSDIMVFSSFFSASFFAQKKPFDLVNKFSKRKDIFAFKVVIFPLHELSHWFLAVLNNETKELCILDPFNPSKYVEKKHIKRLEKLEQHYLKVFFELQSNEKWHPLNKVVKMPPEVPRQSDESSCGVFMLQFAR